MIIDDVCGCKCCTSRLQHFCFKSQDQVKFSAVFTKVSTAAVTHSVVVYLNCKHRTKSTIIPLCLILCNSKLYILCNIIIQVEDVRRREGLSLNLEILTILDLGSFTRSRGVNQINPRPFPSVQSSPSPPPEPLPAIY